MKGLIVFLGVAALSLPAFAAVTEGENLLVNGSFDAEQVAFPEFWTPSSPTQGVVYQRTGGPEGRKAAIVLQTVGKAYCLQFVTADRQDVIGKKFNPRRYGIAAELEGAEMLPDKSFVHVDRRNGGRYDHNDNVAKINLNRIIFRAKSPTQVITFHDAGANPGEELIINFIQLKPYLE